MIDRLEISQVHNEIFSGSWVVSRTLNDAVFFDGVAKFKPQDSAIEYHENGSVIHPNGHKSAAFRSYFFLPHQTGFSVFFDVELTDLFHKVELNSSKGHLFGEAEHLCINDHYHSSYDFKSAHAWEWRHKVRGPKKEYELKASFSRS